MTEKANNNLQYTKLGFVGYLRHHGFALKQCFRQILATPISSVLTFLVIGFAIALPLLLWTVLTNIQSVTKLWESTQVSLYLKKGTSKEEAQRLFNQLQQHSQIAHATFISAEQGIKEFEQQTGLQNVLAALSGNPLPDVITVYPIAALQTPEELSALTTELKKYSQIETVQVDMAWVQRLHTLTQIAQQIVYGLAIMLAIGVLLIIINAIHFISLNASDIIRAIKLVGGSNRFIRRPYLYMGLLYSVIGAVLAIFAVDYLLTLLNVPLQQIANLYQINLSLQRIPDEAIWQVVLISAALGYIGAWVSVTYQLHSTQDY